MHFNNKSAKILWKERCKNKSNISSKKYAENYKWNVDYSSFKEIKVDDYTGKRKRM